MVAPEPSLLASAPGLLVLRPGALGDTLVAVPALRALRRVFGPITLAAHGAAARLLAVLDEVDRGLAFDDSSLGWVFSTGAGTRKDAALGAAGPGARIVAWMSSSNAPGLGGALLVAASRPPGLKQHVAEYLLHSLGPLGEGFALDAQPFDPGSVAALNVGRAVSAAGMPQRGDPLPGPRVEEILVHPGSGSPTKNLQPRRVADVLRRLDCPARLIVGEADHDAAQLVEAALGRALPRLEQPPLQQLAIRLATCRAYLGNDSGVSHLAGLCGARAIVMFGPTSPTLWRPLGPHVQVADFATPPADIARALQD